MERSPFAKSVAFWSDNGNSYFGVWPLREHKVRE